MVRSAAAPMNFVFQVKVTNFHWKVLLLLQFMSAAKGTIPDRVKKFLKVIHKTLQEIKKTIEGWSKGKQYSPLKSATDNSK